MLSPLRRRFAVALALGAHLAVAGMVSIIAWSTVHAATPMPPNMRPLAARDLEIDVVSGDKLLLLSTTSWNSGTGPLRLRGGETVPGGKQNVYQQVRQSDGTYVEQLAGSFIFHAQHNHTHFDDYATYTLTSVNNPATERAATKQTFCIIDTDALRLDLPGAPQDWVYGSCGADVQGMSVGWGDTYTSNLAGQEIDITGLPNGDYFLEVEIDPLDKIEEIDETDNKSTIRVRLSGTNSSNYNVVVLDSDGDGCDDAQELGLFASSGGERNPNNVYDFFDVTHDRNIDLGDTLDILDKFGLGPASPGYDPLFDREVGPPGQEWLSAQATGQSVGIDIRDALANLQSFGHSCA
jgi:hypothetical protein